MSSPSIVRKQVELVSSFIQIPENINTFEFDTYLIDECFILKNIAGYIFKKFLEISKLNIDEGTLTKFIGLVCENYNRNHFHNFQHAVNVLQMTNMLLIETNLFSKIKSNILFATLIAALCHDINHPGNTNSYEINSFSKLARLYNDNSVLENHHCTLTFELLEYTGILKHFRNDDFKEFRKTIITCILGTDMSKHTEFLNKFKNFNFNHENFIIDEQIFIMNSILHCADLSNSIKDFDISFEWSKRISLEFYQQTIKEEIEGLPSLSFMKVHDNLTMCLNEIAFITNISIPMWELFKTKFPKLENLFNKCQNTLKKWKEIEIKYIQENDINTFNY
jgi:hypothetical protein